MQLNRLDGGPVFRLHKLIALLVSISASLALVPISLGQTPALTSVESRQASEMRSLNGRVLRTHDTLQRAAPSEAALLRSRAGTVFVQRARALRALIQTNPREALAFSFSSELLSELAASFPESASVLERHRTWTGPIEYRIYDAADMKSHRSQILMKCGQVNYELHFANSEPAYVKSGKTVQVTGVSVGEEIAVEATTALVAGSTSTITPTVWLNGPEVLNGGLGRILSVLCMVVLAGVALLSVRRAGMLARAPVHGLVVALLVSISTISFAATTSACSTTGVQKTAALVVTIPDGPMPTGITISSLEDVFFAKNTPGISMDGFLKEASYGQTSASGDVFGPYNLSGSYSSCSDVGGTMLNDAVAAAVAAGVNLNNYNRLFLVFPDIWGCGWSGFAQVGSCSLSTTSGTFSLSLSEISAAYTAPRSTGVQLVSHEMGHNLGLLHSGRITPATPTDVLGPLSSPGTEEDLNDWWTAMGSTVIGLYPSPQKAEVLNWMAPTTNFKVVQSSGSYSLQPLETNPPGVQALKVQRGTGNNQWLWIEYRQPIGNYDSTLLPQPFSGALIHYENADTQLGHTYLPNFTPSDTSKMSPALASGQTWVDSYSNLSLSVLSATASSLTVAVNYGTVPCAHANPSISISPLNPSTSPGIATNYTVGITNNDSAGCSSSTFTPTSTQPAGWSSAFSVGSISLSPGQSDSQFLTQTPPSGTAPGTYAITASASNSTYVDSATGNLTVVAAPSMSASLSASATTYTRRSSVGLTATVLNAGSPLSGVSVTFTMTLADGKLMTQAATTNRKGIASWSYKLSQQSPTGMYSVVARASLNSQSATSNTVTFTVQ